jgi:peptidoglycan/LPS O-acetylase OafA/YrhL
VTGKVLNTLSSFWGPLLIAIVGAATAVIITFVKIRKIAIFHFFGLISYSLYLVHVPIGGRVNLGKRFADSEFEFFLISFAGVMLSVFVAYLFYRFIEKPSQKWASAITYRK